MTSTEADLRNLLASVLRERRTELCLSQRELAERAGVSNATISKVELGKLSPTFEMLAKIAVGLELELASLVENVVPREGRMQPTYTVKSADWAAMRRELINQIIRDVGSVQAAANALGVSRSSLTRWLE